MGEFDITASIGFIKRTAITAAVWKFNKTFQKRTEILFPLNLTCGTHRGDDGIMVMTFSYLSYRGIMINASISLTITIRMIKLIESFLLQKEVSQLSWLSRKERYAHTSVQS